MSSKTNIKRSLGLSFLIFLFFLFSAKFVYADGEMISDNTCLDCHDGMEKTLSFTPHKLDNSKAAINCVSCHAGGAEHIEDPSPENIVNPKKTSGFDALDACYSCHKPHGELDNLGFDIHQSQGINCSSCHVIHTDDVSSLRANKPEICYSCHADIQQTFSKRSNHPVKQGAISCLDCHSFSSQVNDDLSYDRQRVCQSCHQEQSGPFMYEHDAANAYMVGGTGCIECHDPHGSENNFLLKQPGNNLCNSCHFEPNHSVAHPNRDYQEYSCVSCHSDHHGSFVSNLFLDPNLNTKFTDNCYQSGCHSIVK